MKKRLLILLVLLSGWTTATLYAQITDAPPISWGRIPWEHLEMDSYAPDTNAAAVILADYGYVYFEDDGDIVFERYTRIKILSVAGYRLGTVAIPYLAKEHQVKGIKGQTYYDDGTGSMKTHKMRRKAIQREAVDGRWKRVQFMLPALRPGVVIEYRYKVITEGAVTLPDWSFQWQEPVLWSMYRVEIPEIFRYNIVRWGAFQPVIEERETYSSTMVWRMRLDELVYDPTVVSTPSMFGREHDTVRLAAEINKTAHRWVMKDVPALRQGPFTTTLDDYYAQIRIELLRLVPPSATTIRATYKGETAILPVAMIPEVMVRKTWGVLAQELMEEGDFGQQIGRNASVRDQAQTLVEGIDDPKEKMKAVYDYLRTTMVWSGRRGIYTGENLDKALAAHRADGPEMALLLVSMLQAVGLEAHPVLISTRSHGQITRSYPKLNQFDDVLAHVEIDDERFLLDARDPLRPYDLLPIEVLNGEGWLVREENPDWIPIEATRRYRHSSYLNATLDAEGTLTVTLQTSDDGYSALEKRHAFKEATSPDAFVQEVMLQGLEAARVDSFSITNDVAVAEPLKTTVAFSTPGYALAAGDSISFNSIPLRHLEENPMRLPERLFPVDMAYPRHLSQTLRLKLPEGYRVQQVPQNIRILLPQEGGYFQRMVDIAGDVLTVQRQFVIMQVVFEPELYPALRSFYEQVVAAEAELVVLKRAAMSEAGAMGRATD